MKKKKTLRQYADYAQVFKQWLLHFPYLPLFFAALSLVMVYLSGNAAQELMQNLSNTLNTGNQVKVVLEKKPISPAEYEPVVSFCQRQLPDVKCQVSGSKFIISISNAQFYTDWIFGLNNMQAHSKDLLWETDKLCVGSCAGSAASATLQAFSQKIVRK